MVVFGTVDKSWEVADQFVFDSDIHFQCVLRYKFFIVAVF